MAINIQISVIAPSKSLFYYDQWRSAVKTAMRIKTAPAMKAFFNLTTDGWKHRPTFYAHYFETTDTIGVQVYTRQRIYAIVNSGSPPHPIRAKRGRMLRFQWGYSASTSPRQLSSRANYRFGEWVGTPLIRRHPGFQAREFDIAVAEAIAPFFVADMAETMVAGLP